MHDPYQNNLNLQFANLNIFIHYELATFSATFVASTPANYLTELPSCFDFKYVFDNMFGYPDYVWTSRHDYEDKFKRYRIN